MSLEETEQVRAFNREAGEHLKRTPQERIRRNEREREKRRSMSTHAREVVNAKRRAGRQSSAKPRTEVSDLDREARRLKRVAQSVACLRQKRLDPAYRAKEREADRARHEANPELQFRRNTRNRERRRRIKEERLGKVGISKSEIEKILEGGVG